MRQVFNDNTENAREILNINSGDILNMAFFYMCRLVSDRMGKKAKDYNEIPVCIVIFIMEGNPFGKKNISYRMYGCLESDEYFKGNECGIMIFNGEYEEKKQVPGIPCV